MEVWKKIKDLNRSVNNNSYDYEEKIFENQIQCRWCLSLMIYDIIIVIRSVFHEDSKY